MRTHKNVISSASTTRTPDTHITQPRTEPQVQARCHRVLVVDDEPLIQRAIVRCLPGHEVVCAGNADDGIRLALSKDFAVVLCDLHMPGTSGGQLYAILRKAKPHLAERMVIVTGGASGGSMERFLECAGLPILEKPFRPSELCRVVARYAPPTGAGETTVGGP